MAYIYMDESGDLGFDSSKKRTSKFFVVTLLFVPKHKRAIEKVVKKTHSELSKKMKKKVGVLHATNEKSTTRKRLLKRLSQQECSIMAIYLNKSKVYTRLQNEKQVLYNYVTNILLDRVCSRQILHTTKNIQFIASRRETNKFLNENFCNYLSQGASSQHGKVLDVFIKTPGEEKILQAVDFASWAIFRKYEHREENFYDILKGRIVEENALFP